MRKKLITLIDGLPNKDILAGYHVTKVGTKWIYVLSMYSNETVKYSYNDFIDTFIKSDFVKDYIRG